MFENKPILRAPERGDEGPASGGDSEKTPDRATAQLRLFSPQRTEGIHLTLPAGWLIPQTENLGNGPLAVYSPDNSTAVIITPVKPNSGRRLASTALNALRKQGADIMQNRRKDIHVGLSTAENRTILARLQNSSRVYDSTTHVVGVESDWLVQVIHRPAESSVKQQAIDEITSITESLVHWRSANN